MSVNFFLVHKAQKAKLNNKNPTQKVKLSTKNDIQHSILRTLSKNKEYIQWTNIILSGCYRNIKNKVAAYFYKVWAVDLIVE